MIIGVNDFCLVVQGMTGFFGVVQVNMPVYQVGWFEYPHKPQKKLETPVTQIGFVMNPCRGGVGNQNIQIPSMEYSVENESGKNA